MIDNYKHLCVEQVAELMTKLKAEVKQLRFIVNTIPNEVWEDMKTWENTKLLKAMQEVME
jgi:hypothetical protein